MTDIDLSQSAREMGKKGGEATFKKHGKQHYQKLAQHMNEVNLQKYGPDYFVKKAKHMVKVREQRRKERLAQSEPIPVQTN